MNRLTITRDIFCHSRRRVIRDIKLFLIFQVASVLSLFNHLINRKVKQQKGYTAQVSSRILRDGAWRTPVRKVCAKTFLTWLISVGSAVSREPAIIPFSQKDLMIDGNVTGYPLLRPGWSSCGTHAKHREDPCRGTAAHRYVIWARPCSLFRYRSFSRAFSNGRRTDLCIIHTL